jgi:hypothetical protein
MREKFIKGGEFQIHDAHAGVGLQPKAPMKVESVVIEAFIRDRPTAFAFS